MKTSGRITILPHKKDLKDYWDKLYTKPIYCNSRDETAPGVVQIYRGCKYQETILIRKIRFA